LNVQGSNDVTISTDDIDGATVKNELDGATLTVESTQAGAIDLSKVSANLIDLKGAAAGNITVADGQSLKLSVDQTAGTAFTGTGTLNVDVALAATQADLDVTALTSADFDVTKDLTVTKLTTDADTAVTFSGAGKATVTTVGVSDVDASATTSKFTYTGADALQSVTGSSTAENVVTFKNVATNAAYVGGAGVDTVDASTLTTGTLTANTGAGNDVIIVKDITTNAGTLTIDGGAGTDTLKTGAAVDFTAAKLTLTNIENLDITTGSEFAGYQLNGSSFSVAGQATNSSFTVTADAVKDKNGTIDLSGLTLSTAEGSNIDAVTIDGTTGSETIIGTSTADTISGGTGADTLTGGAGADTFKFGVDDSDADNIDVIKDFNVAASGNDIIDNVSGVVGVNVTTGVNVNGAISGGTGSETVTATVSKGIISLSGVDAGEIDTLAEWIAVASTAGVIVNADDDAVGTVAFQFGGNTYLVESNDATSGATTDGTADVQIDNVIELTGVTGITALDTAAAANTIVIA
jgi:Ca2+-binding RTX toxin-like protein